MPNENVIYLDKVLNFGWDLHEMFDWTNYLINSFTAYETSNVSMH